MQLSLFAALNFTVKQGGNREEVMGKIRTEYRIGNKRERIEVEKAYKFLFNFSLMVWALIVCHMHNKHGPIPLYSFCLISEFITSHFVFV